MRSGHFKSPLRCSTTAPAVCHCMRLKAGGEKMTDGNLTIQNGIAYANHDGVELAGDLYLPKKRSRSQGGAGFGRRAWRRLGRRRARRLPILGTVSRRARHRGVLHQLPAGDQDQDIPGSGAGRACRRAIPARQGRRLRHRSGAHRVARRLGRRAPRGARGARRQEIRRRLSAGSIRCGRRQRQGAGRRLWHLRRRGDVDELSGAGRPRQ